MLDISYGYCHCGCGGKTNIATKNHTRSGYIKGQPYRFLPNHHSRIDLALRFWAKVDIKGATDCWEWTACKDGHGYGQIGYQGTYVKAPRISWLLHFGPIPEGEGYHGTCVCHECDNPGCVNPNHLFLGTNQDNVDDKKQKGRDGRSPGEKNGMVKLTAEQVKEIRAIGSSMLQRQIAARYGVEQTSISMILRRKRWAHI